MIKTKYVFSTQFNRLGMTALEETKKNIESLLTSNNMKILSLTEDTDGKLSLDIEAPEKIDNIHELYKYISDNAPCGVMTHIRSLNKLPYARNKYKDEYNTESDKESLKSKYKITEDEFDTIQIAELISENHKKEINEVINENKYKNMSFNETKDLIPRIILSITGDVDKRLYEWLCNNLNFAEVQEMGFFKNEDNANDIYDKYRTKKNGKVNNKIIKQ